MLVMVCYPLLSVYPQGILYRGLFYARYADLFRSERGAWVAGAAAFSLAHLVFANVWAVGLTFAGGLLFNRTYRKTGSLLASDVEHAVCGQWVFTFGWGRSCTTGRRNWWKAGCGNGKRAGFGSGLWCGTLSP
jgi:membrane protease YdiL (CAAX protease family)